MTTLRSECRATLAWCLEQPEVGFTQRECYEHFKVHQVAISKNFCRLERLGALKREHLQGRQYLFSIGDREYSEKLVKEKPKPHNGYIPVSQRSRRWANISSIFHTDVQMAKPIDPQGKRQNRSVSLYPAQREAFDKLGGSKWLQEQIEREIKKQAILTKPKQSAERTTS